MDEFAVEEILPVKAISDTERRHRTWLLRKKLKKRNMKKLKEKSQKLKKRKSIDIYV